MSTTLTKDATVITPVQTLGYSSTQQTGNIVHAVVGRNDPDISFAAAGLRTGTLSFLFLTLADALACRSLHASVGITVLADTDLPGIGMRYVASGAIDVELDDESRLLWIVSVEFQEVA
jgi:hypothetical protein